MNKIELEKAKFKRKLLKEGKSYSFSRVLKNEFGEIINETPVVVQTASGIFHETQAYITVSTSEGSRQSRMPSPMILCQWEEVSTQVKRDDVITINGMPMKVTAINNVGNIDVYGDISLEVQNNGVNVGL